MKLPRGNWDCFETDALLGMQMGYYQAAGIEDAYRSALWAKQQYHAVTKPQPRSLDTSYIAKSRSLRRAAIETKPLMPVHLSYETGFGVGVGRVLQYAGIIFSTSVVTVRQFEIGEQPIDPSTTLFNDVQTALVMNELVELQDRDLYPLVTDVI